MNKKQDRREPGDRRQAAPDPRQHTPRRAPAEERRTPEQRRTPRAERPAERRAPRPEQRPEPERRAPRPEQRPEPERRAPRPEQRPEPERRAPRPAQRPEPERRAPRPEQRPEPERRAPRPEQRPAPERRAPRPAQRQAPERRAPRPGQKTRPARPEQKKAPRKQPKQSGSLLERFVPGLKQRRASEPPQGTSYERSTKKPSGGIFSSGRRMRPSEAVARKSARAEQAEHKRKQAARFDTPAVIYTQPKPFNRNRLFVQLVTVLTAAVAFVMALSIFFRVKVITISGAETYSAWAVREAAGIMEGDHLLTFGRAGACGKILANLPYVEKARIGIKLPDTVNIEIEELDVAYSVEGQDGGWWLITSQGKVVEQINIVTAENYTKVLGVKIDTPIVGEDAKALEAPPTETLESGEDAPVLVTGGQRLNAALEILQALENNDIVGEAASVNVADLQDIELWYGQRYQVSLGDSSNLPHKIDCMYDVILQMKDYQTGMLDISFNTISDEVVYTPFA